MATKKAPGKRTRDAGTGRFVKKGTAKRRPKTTVEETVKPRRKKSSKKGKKR